MMTIFKCGVGLDDGFVVICDGIKYDNKLWLVPEWRENTAVSTITPKRMIRFDDHPYNYFPDDPQAQYINILLPKAVLDGLSEEGFEVLNHPTNLSFDSQERLPKKPH